MFPLKLKKYFVTSQSCHPKQNGKYLAPLFKLKTFLKFDKSFAKFQGAKTADLRSWLLCTQVMTEQSFQYSKTINK